MYKTIAHEDIFCKQKFLYVSEIEILKNLHFLSLSKYFCFYKFQAEEFPNGDGVDPHEDMVTVKPHKLSNGPMIVGGTGSLDSMSPSAFRSGLKFIFTHEKKITEAPKILCQTIIWFELMLNFEHNMLKIIIKL